MNRRLSVGVAFAAAAVFAAPLANPGDLSAQEGAAGGRYRVLVPDFFATQGAKRDFGEKVAEDLRERLDGLATHMPIQDKEVTESLRKFKMKMEDLDCIKARQLASQINAQVVLCASYSGPETAQAMTGVQFIDVGTGETFDVPDGTFAKGQEAQASEHIFTAFDKYVQQIRFTQFCGDYQASRQWDNAVTNCRNALELNPGAWETRFQLAKILYEQAKEAPEAEKQAAYKLTYDELLKVIAARDFHEEALQLAGYLSIQLGDEAAGREHYKKYLELNPGANTIRLRIAYDMGNAGDPEGAMMFIKEGLDHNPTDPALLEYYGIYAFSTAEKKKTAAGAENAGAPSPELSQLYRDAITALSKVYDNKGAEANIIQLRNIIAAYAQLKETDQAIQFSQRVLTTHPNEQPVWVMLANLLKESNRTDDAIAALDKADAITPNVAFNLLQANWLMAEGRHPDAIVYFKKAIEKDPTKSMDAANAFFADAHANGVTKKDNAYALRVFAIARDFNNTGEMKSQLDFWEGYLLFQAAIARATELTKEETTPPRRLEVSREVKPLFERARGLLEGGRAYGAKQNINVGQIINAATQYIDIADNVIKRAG